MTITEIQKALLSNTKYIKEEEAAEQETVAEVSKPVPPQETVTPVIPAVQIDPSTLKKLKILAAYQKISVDELVNSALNHFLKLKSMQLEEAILKLTEE